VLLPKDQEKEGNIIRNMAKKKAQVRLRFEIPL